MFAQVCDRVFPWNNVPIGVYTGPAASWQTLGPPLEDHNKTWRRLLGL